MEETKKEVLAVATRRECLNLARASAMVLGLDNLLQVDHTVSACQEEAIKEMFRAAKDIWIETLKVHGLEPDTKCILDTETGEIIRKVATTNDELKAVLAALRNMVMEKEADACGS
jgi:hypothetical protein